MPDDRRLDEVLVLLLAFGAAAVVLGLCLYYGLVRTPAPPLAPQVTAG